MDDIQAGDQFLYAGRTFTVIAWLEHISSFHIQEVSNGHKLNHHVSGGFLSRQCTRIVDTNALPYSHRS